jgi:hypothetical protein
MPTKYTIEDAPAQSKYTVEDSTPHITEENGSIRPLTERERFSDPELYPVGAKGETLGENLYNLAQRAGVGIFQLADALSNPRQTAAGTLSSVLPEPVVTAINKIVDTENRIPVLRYLTTKLPTGTTNPVQQAYKAVQPGGWEAAGNVAPLAGQAIAGGAFGDVTGPITKGLRDTAAKMREGTRTTAQRFVGAGERAVKGEVEKAAERGQKAYEATQAANQAATEKTLNARAKVDQAREETRRANNAAQKAVEEYNRAQQSAYQANLDEAGRANLNAHIKHLQDAAETAKKNAADAKKVEEANRVEYARYERELAEAQRKNTEAHVKYQQEKAEAEQANAAARAIPDSRAGLETYIADQSKDLRAEIETSREEALRVGNQKYSAVNAELSPLEADGEAVQGAIADAVETLRGSHAEPTLIRAIVAKSERGDSWTYEDLQGDYSRLGRELSKGTVPGDEFKAYDKLHEAFGDEMQRIADENGKGAELKAARDYWRQMKQAFGKEYNPTDAATKTMERTSPEWSRAEDAAKQLNLLSAFNHTIPEIAQRIESARNRLSSLPGEGMRPTAKTPEYPEEKTVKPPNIQNPPQPKEPPAYPEEKTVESPKQKPSAEAKPLPEHTEPHGSTPFERETVNTQKLREQLVDRWARGETGLNKFQVRALVAGPIGGIIGYVLGHGEAGAGLGYGLATAFGPELAARFVERPGVKAWLTRPPDAELEVLRKLPNADRVKIEDGLGQVVRQAQKQGVQVSPALAALVGAGVTGPATRNLQKIRDEHRANSPAQ